MSSKETKTPSEFDYSELSRKLSSSARPLVEAMDQDRSLNYRLGWMMDRDLGGPEGQPRSVHLCAGYFIDGTQGTTYGPNGEKLSLATWTIGEDVRIYLKGHIEGRDFSFLYYGPKKDTPPKEEISEIERLIGKTVEVLLTVHSNPDLGKVWTIKDQRRTSREARKIATRS